MSVKNSMGYRENSIIKTIKYMLLCKVRNKPILLILFSRVRTTSTLSETISSLIQLYILHRLQSTIEILI